MSASLSLFDKEHAAREKYIYFICGVTGALIAYIGKDYRPSNPWTNHDTLTVSVLSCLVLSFGFGLLRILFYIHGMSHNRDVLVAEEELAIINNSLTFHMQNLDKGVPISIGTKNPKYYKKEDLENRRKELIQSANEKRPKMEFWHTWSTGFLWVANALLFVGFVLLVLSKLPDSIITRMFNVFY